MRKKTRKFMAKASGPLTITPALRYKYMVLIQEYSLTMKSYTARTGEVLRAWYVVDAQDKVLGRLASRIAMALRGKTKPTFTPHIDTGDFVVVVNAAQVQLTGRKLDNKFYYRHSGFPGGIKEISARKLLQKKPEEILRHAVRGCCPKTVWEGSC